MTFTTDDAINEKSSAHYSCTFKDPTGATINTVAISSILATLVDGKTGTPINSRNAQSVLNANGGTLDVNGVFTLALSASDTIAIGVANYQARRLTLSVAYTGGTLTHEVSFYVRALPDIT